MPADGILKVFSKFRSQTALEEVEIYPEHCGEILKYFQNFKQSSDIFWEFAQCSNVLSMNL